MRKILKLGAEPAVVVHHKARAYGASFVPGHPTFVEIFQDIIKNGKIRWRRIGEARLDEKYGLHAIPYALPYEASLLLTEALQENQ